MITSSFAARSLIAGVRPTVHRVEPDEGEEVPHDVAVMMARSV